MELVLLFFPLPYPVSVLVSDRVVLTIARLALLAATSCAYCCCAYCCGYGYCCCCDQCAVFCYAMANAVAIAVANPIAVAIAVAVAVDMAIDVGMKYFYCYCLRQAEVNLVFNQLLFDLEAEVFGYFKDWAASTVLDKMFKRVYEARRGWGHFIPGRRRYEVRCQIEINQTFVGWGG